MEQYTIVNGDYISDKISLMLSPEFISYIDSLPRSICHWLLIFQYHSFLNLKYLVKKLK